MSRPASLILLSALLGAGGTAAFQPGTTRSDAGAVIAGPDAGTVSANSDAGSITARPILNGPDAGPASRKPDASGSIPWPEEELAPLATLDGPAILAAHAALQQAMKRFPKEYTKECTFSPKALEMVIGYQAGWYFIRVNHRVDKCPGFGPGFSSGFDGFELYAYSPDGRLERYPYAP